MNDFARKQDKKSLSRTWNLKWNFHQIWHSQCKLDGKDENRLLLLLQRVDLKRLKKVAVYNIERKNKENTEQQTIRAGITVSHVLKNVLFVVWNDFRVERKDELSKRTNIKCFFSVCSMNTVHIPKRQPNPKSCNIKFKKRLRRYMLGMFGRGLTFWSENRARVETKIKRTS